MIITVQGLSVIMIAKPVKTDPMKGLWLRGDVYWLAYTPIKGMPQERLSLKTTDLAEAIQKAREVRAFPERYRTREDGDLVELFLAHQQRRGISKARIDFSRMVLAEVSKCASGKIAHLSPAMASLWWSGLLGRIKPKSAKDYLGVVTVFYRWSVDAGHVKTSPVALIIPPKIRPSPRRVFLTPVDARRVLDEAEDPDLRFALLCALHCGLRRGEVIAARPHWFDLNAGLLHVQNESDWLTKDRDNRTVPLTAEFRDFLAWYGIQSPYMLRPDVLPKESNRTWRYRTDFAKQFNGHMARLGLAHVTFHDCRRTFASMHVSHGTPIYHVAKWLGDEIGVVESTYGHLLPNDDRINGPWGGGK